MTMTHKARKAIFHKASLMLNLQWTAARQLLEQSVNLPAPLQAKANVLIDIAQIQIAERIYDIASRRRILA